VRIGVFPWLWLNIAATLLWTVTITNAMNLLDNMDGLSGGIAAIAAVFFLLFAAMSKQYLVGALAAALVGACVGFLRYNLNPARIFMGDTGSLALGGALGAIAVATKHELVLGVVGGLFVVEALSVIIQVAWFKRTGKRVFLMAPIHHHFEKKGWREETIVIRFWIISVILALIGLATLKLR